MEVCEIFPPVYTIFRRWNLQSVSFVKTLYYCKNPTGGNTVWERYRAKSSHRCISHYRAITVLRASSEKAARRRRESPVSQIEQTVFLRKLIIANSREAYSAEREREREREKERERYLISQGAFHLAPATLANVICPCLTFDKQQGWNDSRASRASNGTQPWSIDVFFS